VPKGERQLANPSWVFHSGVGYIFPKEEEVYLSNHSQTGSWFRINRQTSSSKEELSMDVFKLWINHGTRADNAEYSYIVLPATTQEKVKRAAANPAIDILSNTPQLQAVWHRGLHILQAVFYKNGEINLASGLKVTMDTPGILMIKTEGNEVKEISVSDPSRKSGKIHFSVNKKLTIQSDQAYSFWNESKGVSEIAINLPQALIAGKSVTVNL
jgi:chondroitin AC lyase